MDTPRKNNDCYFYYYSTCTKGDKCLFRHEEGALGCEVVCAYWKEGKCFNQHCNFRHMELKKNRKSIPCYWETQPSGCCKPHCPFFHRNPKSVTDKPKEGQIEAKAEPAAVSPTRRQSQGNESSFGNASVVDPVVVSFEEESDNESVPSTPHKTKPTRVSVKTLEQIKLDKIQAESAAYYSLPSSSFLQGDQDLSFHIMSLEEIRTRKGKVEDCPLQPDSTTMKREEDDEDVKVKNTTEEHRTKKPIRLKRWLKRSNSSTDNSQVILKRVKLSDNAVVSSTNSDSSVTVNVTDEPINVREVLVRTIEDDLLKDIDALLGD